MRITKDSTRRALRTLLQAAIALPTVIPALAWVLARATDRLGADHPAVRWGLSILAGLALVTKAMAWLEERGYVRPLLRALDDPALPGITPPGQPRLPRP